MKRENIQVTGFQVRPAKGICRKYISRYNDRKFYKPRKRHNYPGTRRLKIVIRI